ncbi:hypothetical protein GCM10007908_05810 [Rhizobium albus]|nr:hypothetical protein GCM10007908_05810 [Rhizobium albus]
MAATEEPSDPFVHTIMVQWADCDPARIAYTGQIPKFALSAIDAWWAERVGIDWFALNVDHRMGTPFVHLDMDFRSPITPRHPLLCTVMLTKLGTTSLTFRVVGRQNEAVCFEGNFVCVAVSADDFRPGYPSAEIRIRLESLLSEPF